MTQGGAEPGGWGRWEGIVRRRPRRRGPYCGSGWEGGGSGASGCRNKDRARRNRHFRRKHPIQSSEFLESKDGSGFQEPARYRLRGDVLHLESGGFSGPYPCCGNQKRRCVLPPTRPRNKVLVFEATSVLSPPSSPTRPVLLHPKSSPLASSRSAGLSVMPSHPQQKISTAFSTSYDMGLDSLPRINKAPRGFQEPATYRLQGDVLHLESGSFSGPCPCCGNWKRRCLLPPTRSHNKVLVF